MTYASPYSSPASAHMDRWQQERRILETEFSERITLDALTGAEGECVASVVSDDAGGKAGWLIAQRKIGHRHSIDDVLTAWYALQKSPPVTEHLDLGTGIGTVGLLTLWGMGPEARLTCIEAQEISYRLLQTNIDANGLRSRVETRFGDLRDMQIDRRFPLITGSPPYFPPGSGIIPQDTQKAHARFELRGDVGAYANAAAAHMTADGWFVLCFPTPQQKRAFDGIAAAGLVVVRFQEVIPRESLPPLFTLFACRHASSFDGETGQDESFVVRWENGQLTPAMNQVRRSFGFPDRESIMR